MINLKDLITGDELEKKLAESTAPRVTQDYIKNRIKSMSFVRFQETVTLCSIVLDNGYSVRGESACVNPENYNEAIGEKIAYEDAFKKLWPLFGFALAEKQFMEKQ